MAWTPESHWDEHDWFTVEDWKDEVANDHTRLSYVQWVNASIDLLEETRK